MTFGETGGAGARTRVGRIFTILVNGRHLVAYCGAAGFALGFLYLVLSAVPYAATAVVSPAPDRDAGTGRRSSGAAALLGMSAGLIGKESVSTFDEFIATTRSTELAQHLNSRYGLARRVFASQWNAKLGRWEQPHGPISRLNILLNRLVGRPGWLPPSDSTLALYLQRNVQIVRDDKTGLATFYYSHKDPKLAEWTLRILHDEADLMVRERALARLRGTTSYLLTQLNSATAYEYKTALAAALASEQERLMLAENNNVSYAAEFIDPPVATINPNSMSSIGTLLMALFGGVTAGVLFLFAKDTMSPSYADKYTNTQSSPNGAE